MRNKIELLVKELKAANAIEVSLNSDYAKSMGYKDIATAMTEITDKDGLYMLAFARVNLVGHMSRYIQRLEKILEETSAEYKRALFKRVFKSEIEELSRDKFNTDMDTLRNIAYAIEADLKETNHGNEDIIMIDGEHIDVMDQENIARACMEYLDVDFEEEE